MIDPTYHRRLDGGIADFVQHINASKGVAHQHIIYVETEAETDERLMSAEIALQWNNTYAESVYTFANTINTTEGGTHEEGFRSALTTLVNKFAREWNILKEKDINLSGEDVREGLTAIISVKLAEPQFEGQTKTKLGNTEMNADELWDTTMDPANRVLQQITLDDAAQADEMFSVLMGEDVESRRNFIQQNAHDVRFLDI